MPFDPAVLAAQYARHRDAMHRVAASVLWEAGLTVEAPDAVNDAVVSILQSPPDKVENWEAFLVSAAKRKAIDRIRSARVKHAGPELDPERHGRSDGSDIADDVAEDVDRQRQVAAACDDLSVLDERHRIVAWQYIALGRPRAEVAVELGVTPARVSQMSMSALTQLREEMTRREGTGHE